MSTRLANYNALIRKPGGSITDWPSDRYECDAISINSQGELFICDDDDKVIADYPRMGWVDVTITRNYDS